jgi:hypothetical protein
LLTDSDKAARAATSAAASISLRERQEAKRRREAGELQEDQAGGAGAGQKVVGEKQRARPIPAAGALPEGWQEMSDGAGGVCYYNEAAGTTTADRPGEKVEKTAKKSAFERAQERRKEEEKEKERVEARARARSDADEIKRQREMQERKQKNGCKVFAPSKFQPDKCMNCGRKRIAHPAPVVSPPGGSAGKKEKRPSWQNMEKGNVKLKRQSVAQLFEAPKTRARRKSFERAEDVSALQVGSYWPRSIQLLTTVLSLSAFGTPQPGLQGDGASQREGEG